MDDIRGLSLMTGLQIFNVVMIVLVIGMYVLSFILKKTGKGKGDVRKSQSDVKIKKDGDKK